MAACAGQPPEAIGLYLERHAQLGDVLLARWAVPHEACDEPLVPIPGDRVTLALPHAYLEAGASYGGASPFALREGVLRRLLDVADRLEAWRPGHRLKVFDGYRPRAVQAHMRHRCFEQLARQAGIDLRARDAAAEEAHARLWEQVDRLWAPAVGAPGEPPPPHATGAAVDLTIVDALGQALDMGSDFDEPSERILPYHYTEAAQHDPRARLIDENRHLLDTLMRASGFRRITHEWWHFSYGDAVWALIRRIEGEAAAGAVYGEVALATTKQRA